MKTTLKKSASIEDTADYRKRGHWRLIEFSPDGNDRILIDDYRPADGRDVTGGDMHEEMIRRDIYGEENSDAYDWDGDSDSVAIMPHPSNFEKGANDMRWEWVPDVLETHYVRVPVECLSDGTMRINLSDEGEPGLWGDTYVCPDPGGIEDGDWGDWIFRDSGKADEFVQRVIGKGAVDGEMVRVGDAYIDRAIHLVRIALTDWCESCASEEGDAEEVGDAFDAILAQLGRKGGAA